MSDNYCYKTEGKPFIKEYKRFINDGVTVRQLVKVSAEQLSEYEDTDIVMFNDFIEFPDSMEDAVQNPEWLYSWWAFNGNPELPDDIRDLLKADVKYATVYSVVTGIRWPEMENEILHSNGRYSEMYREAFVV